MSEVHLKDLSKVYSEQIAESGVGYEPGKPATKMGAVTGIPKADQMSAAERIKKKTAEKKAALEKKHGKKMDDHPEYPNKKYVDEADMSGAPSIKDAKPAKKTNVKYDPHMKVMAPQVEKEEVEVDEAMSSYDRNRKRAAQRAADRNAARAAGKTGVVPGVGYVSPRKERETYVDSSGTTRHKSGAKMEALDPVGKEDGDVNNDGKKDSSDSYLMKRRAAIAKALGKKKQTEEVENPSKDLKGAVKKAVKRIDHNVSGDVDKNDKSMGNYGEFVPSADGKKRLTTKIGEGYSNWRTDIAEVMDDIESKPIKEKTVKNKVTINPKLTEAVEEIGGQVLEVTEVEQVDELYKGKHGQTEKQYADSRSSGGKMVSGDSKMSGAEYTHGRRVKAANPGMQPDVGGKTKPKSQGKMDKGTRADLQYRKVNLRKEEASMSPQEIQLQKKKAMIDKLIATKRQQGLTKAKKSEEPAKAVGEEMSIKDQMRISREANAKRKPYQPGDREKQRAAQMRNAAKNAKKDTRTDAQKMTDATGPRDAFGRPAKSGYRGD
tara:strand:+ start:884 stop:2524 length:1641 start_codon:yes stop_codon:yes gene_type:complete